MEELQTLSIGVSAVVAALSLAATAWSQVGRRRDDQLALWRRVVVHQILQRHPGPILFTDILEKFRSEALANEALKVKAKEMSPQAMRAVLMELVRDNVVSQTAKDTYEIYDRNGQLGKLDGFQAAMMGSLEGFQASRDADGNLPNMMEMMSKIANVDFGKMSEVLHQDFQIRNCALVWASEEPGRYNLSDLTIKVSKETNIDPDIVKGRIIQLTATGHLLTNGAGKLSVGSRGIDEPSLLP